MKCLIIAAGRGRRLQQKGFSKPLVPVLGRPLIERVIRTAVGAGVDEVYVVTGYKGTEVCRSLNNLAGQCRVSINHIHNREWDRGGNGISVLKAKAHLNENFILMMGDHLIDPALLKGLLTKTLSDGEIMLAVDRDLKNPLIDIKDATKVWVHGGKVEKIGKDLDNFNGLDAGLFLCSPAIFGGIEKSINEHADSSLTGAVRCLAERGKVNIFDIGKKFWIDVDDPLALKKAEGALLRGLRGKRNDGPVSRYLNRPLSIRLSRYLARFPITPNQISFLTFLLSLLSAGLFLAGSYGTLLLGGMLAQFASILDGCDGEIARLKFQESAYGGWFDAVLDRYADGFLLFGLTWHAYMAGTHVLVLLAGFMAIMGSFMVSYTADKYDALMSRLIRSRPRIGRDFRIFLIFLGALSNQIFWTLIITAVLMNGEALRRIYACRID